MNRILNGRYRIDGVVGDGGMAVVYRGWDLVLNRVVAIKVLREQYAMNESFLARFRREAQSAAGLAHPNIVNVYDVGRDGDTWYIVQELIDGTDLATLIRQRGQFTVADATEVIAQVAVALDYAHSRGIIHRDVKPHNILIDSRGTAKVVDFGIAKGVNDITDDRCGHGARHGGVHLARAGDGRAAYRRERPLQHGRRPLRDVDRAPALRRRHRSQRGDAACPQCAAAAVTLQRENPAPD